MKCLVTTYAAGTDAKLMRYKHCLFFYKERKDAKTTNISITYPNDDVERTANIISDEGYFIDSNGSNLGTSIKLKSGLNIIQITEGSSFDIPNDFKAIDVTYHVASVGFDLSTAKYVKNCSNLSMSYSSSRGDISNLKSLGENVSSIVLLDCDITGNISSLSGLTNLTNLDLRSKGITGDISSIIDKLTKLTNLGISKNVKISDEQKATLVNRGCTVTISNY